MNTFSMRLQAAVNHLWFPFPTIGTLKSDTAPGSDWPGSCHSGATRRGLRRMGFTSDARRICSRLASQQSKPSQVTAKLDR